jgi:hypothetical protein
MIYPVYIPSRYRSDNASTARLLNKTTRPYHMVVHPDETNDYKQNYSKAMLISTHKQKSVASARQFILEWCKKYHLNTWCWMMDDDIIKVGYYLDTFQETELNNWMTKIETLVHKIKPQQYNISQIGFQHSTFNIKGNSININTNIGAIQLIYIPHIIKLKLNYSINMTTLEDTDFIIKLLQKEYNNMKLKQFVFYTMPSGKKNKTGGLAKIYHDGGKEKGIKKFQKKYPNLITMNSDITKYRIKWYKFKNKKLENLLINIISDI